MRLSLTPDEESIALSVVASGEVALCCSTHVPKISPAEFVGDRREARKLAEFANEGMGCWHLAPTTDADERESWIAEYLDRLVGALSP